MTYEEIVNGANTDRRDKRCRQDRISHMAMQWGGWLLAALIFAAQAH